MTDPGEDICDAIVDYINNLSPWPFAFQFQASKPDDIHEESMREHADLKVFLTPFGIEEERIDRSGKAVLRVTVAMLVVRRLTDGPKRHQLNALSFSIRNALRGKKQAGWTWTGADTIVQSDPEQISELQQYVHVSHLVYYGIEGC